MIKKLILIGILISNTGIFAFGDIYNPNDEILSEERMFHDNVIRNQLYSNDNYRPRNTWRP
jgi:hypothetical protein